MFSILQFWKLRYSQNHSFFWSFRNSTSDLFFFQPRNNARCAPSVFSLARQNSGLRAVFFISPTPPPLVRTEKQVVRDLGSICSCSMESWDPDAPMNKTALDASMAAKGGKKERGISRIPPDTGCLISLLLHPRFDWGRNTGADNRSSFCPVL